MCIYTTKTVTMHGGRGKGENTGSSGNPGKVNKRRGMLYPSRSMMTLCILQYGLMV